MAVPAKSSTKGREGWSARNDHIVLLYELAGLTQKEIGDRFGLSPQTISGIINDPRAAEIKETARKELRQRILNTVEDELTAMQKLSVKVLKKTLEADISPIHGAKPNQDRVALDLLKGMGFLSKEQERDGGGLTMTNEQFERFMEGIQKSDEAAQVDPFSVREAEWEPEEPEGEVENVSE